MHRRVQTASMQCFSIVSEASDFLMPALAISRRRHAVFWLFIRASVCDHILKVCERIILLNACGLFRKYFITQLQLETKMN